MRAVVEMMKECRVEIERQMEFQNEYEDELLLKFKDHCAQLIQKCWRGHKVRRFVDRMKRVRRRRLAIFPKYVKGWIVRRILSGCQEIIELRKYLSELQGQLSGISDPRDPEIQQIMSKRQKCIC